VKELAAAPLRNLFEAAAHLGVGAWPWKEAPNQSAIVQPGATHDDRPPPAIVNLFDDGDRVANVARGGVFVRWLDDIDEVVRNAAPLGGRNFVRADIEAAIDRRRIAADDFAAAPERELDAQRAFACRRGTQNGENRRPQSRVPRS